MLITPSLMIPLKAYGSDEEKQASEHLSLGNKEYKKKKIKNEEISCGESLPFSSSILILP